MTLALFLAYANTNKQDIKVRNTLVKMNLNLARKVAHKAKSHCDESYQDLEQEASLGLIAAVERFDPQRGCAFSSYAVPIIYGKILQYLRDRSHTIRLSQSIQTLETKGRQVMAAMTQELGRKPTLAEVAERLGTSEEEYRCAVVATRNAKGLTPIDGDTEEWLYKSNTLEIEDEVPELKKLDTSWLTEGEIKALKGKGKGDVWSQLSFA